jgi:SAM-dependent methyltransferase
MPTLEENIHLWNNEFEWLERGDEWSKTWGNATSQWYWSILPRIHAFLPAENILEIAPGHGRWTQFLLSHCQSYQGYDLSQKCVDACKSRFQNNKNAEFFLNDGLSLGGVKSGSIDFVFSFDSLVHAEIDVLKSYLSELRRILSPTGVAFIHHSNLLDYRGNFRIAQKIPRGKRWLSKLGLVETEYHWRAPSVNATEVRERALELGLTCPYQELVNWKTRRLIDCFTVLTQKNPQTDRPFVLIKNKTFMNEARAAKRHAETYSAERRK